MKNSDLFKKWLLLAEEDFEMANIAFNNDKYLFSAFHLQQSIEKSLKAIYILKKDSQPPYIHDLNKLYILLKDELDLPLENYYKLFSALTPFYVQARYPSYKENTMKTLTKNILIKYIETAKGFLSWLKTMKN